MIQSLRRLISKFKKPSSVLVATDNQVKIDLLQHKMEQMVQLDCPLTHRFTPGLYYRECVFPKGALVVTKIHKSEHPFVITKGEVSVWVDGVGVVRMKAPCVGVTMPGTRRIIYAHEETFWMTFHPTKKTDPEEIENDIIEPRDVGYELSKYVEQELKKELT